MEATSCQHLAPCHGPRLSVFNPPTYSDGKAKLLFFLQKRLSNTAILNLCLILLTYLITRHKLPFFLKKYLSIQYLGYYFMKVCQWYDAEQLRFCTIFQLFLWKSNCTLRFQCSMTKLCALSKGYSLHSEMSSCVQCDLLLDIAFIFILLFFKFPVWILI